MTQSVKIFYDTDKTRLETNVNDFLQSIPDKKIIDIRQSAARYGSYVDVVYDEPDHVIQTHVDASNDLTKLIPRVNQFLHELLPNQIVSINYFSNESYFVCAIQYKVPK